MSLTTYRIAPIALPIRKDLKYGGIERGVADIDEYLTKKGITSIVATTADSKVKGIQYNTIPQSLWKGGIRTDKKSLEEHCNKAIDGILKYSPDVIHDHEATLITSEAYQKRKNSFDIPILVTLHCNISCSKTLQKLMNFKQEGKKIFFNTLSKAQKELYTKIIDVKYFVYNGIDPSEFSFLSKKKDFLFSLGSLVPGKGQDIAIDVAKKLNKTLLLGGPLRLHKKDSRIYWEEKIKPRLDDACYPENPEEIETFLERESEKSKVHGEIVYLGELDNNQKKIYFKHSKCFLMPVRWVEAFGRVTIEAMACGTPVVAFDKGPMREIIEDKKTGYVVNSLDEMVDSVKKIDKINPYKCRERVEKNFTVTQQVEKYIKIYKEIVSKTNET